MANTRGGIHHGASAVQNARAIGEDILHLLPDRAVLSPVMVAKEGFFAALGSFFIGLVMDIIELVMFPLMLVKNLIDIAAHGIQAAINAIRGRGDGEAQAVSGFDYFDTDSGTRLLWQRDRQERRLDRDLTPVLGLAEATELWKDMHPDGARVPAEAAANFNGDVTWAPKWAFRPGPSIDELSAVMRTIRRELPAGTRIKAGGSKHSYGAGQSDAVYIHPEGMRFIERVHGSDSLVRLGAGVRIQQANEALWGMGRALKVLGGYDGQTIAGAISTGTHGAVPTHGPLSDMVRSVDLVRPDGTKVRIEPKNGITDRAKFCREHPDMELIQDDTVFRAMKLNLGAFGVIHSAVLDTAPKFYLKEQTIVSDVQTVRKELAGKGMGFNFPGLPKDPYHAWVLFNPYTEKAQVLGAVKVEHTETEDRNERVTSNMLKAGRRGSANTRPILQEWALSNVPWLVNGVLQATRHIAPGHVPGVLNSSVSGGDEYTDRSYNVFYTGDSVSQIPARFCEFFVPVSGDKHLLAMDVLCKAAQKWAKMHGQYQTGPTNMRLVKGGNELIGRNGDYAAFEVMFAGPPDYATDMMKFYREELKKVFGDEVTQHFGMMAPGVTSADIIEEFPEYEAWRRIRDNFDPYGQMLSPAQEKLFPRRIEIQTKKKKKSPYLVSAT